VTVGLSLSIPLALLGQAILNSQSSSLVYWLGAVLVLVAFLLINHETKDAEVVQSALPNEDSGEASEQPE
jgi:solute carrier family 35, member F5